MNLLFGQKALCGRSRILVRHFRPAENSNCVSGNHVESFALFGVRLADNIRGFQAWCPCEGKRPISTGRLDKTGTMYGFRLRGKQRLNHLRAVHSNAISRGNALQSRKNPSFFALEANAPHGLGPSPGPEDRSDGACPPIPDSRFLATTVAGLRFLSIRSGHGPGFDQGMVKFRSAVPPGLWLFAEVGHAGTRLRRPVIRKRRIFGLVE